MAAESFQREMKKYTHSARNKAAMLGIAIALGVSSVGSGGCGYGSSTHRQYYKYMHDRDRNYRRLQRNLHHDRIDRERFPDHHGYRHFDRGYRGGHYERGFNRGYRGRGGHYNP